MVDKNTCTSCHQVGVKIHRRHKSKRFCQKCYFKYFKKDTCTSCGKTVRLPTFELNPVCIACDRDKPCVRCGKEDYEIGKITEYGPVCNSCYFYFKDPEQCQQCGKKSRRLSTYSHLDHDLKVCLKCMRKNYGTCSSCRRYRQLYPDTSNVLKCKKCLLVGEKPCEKCGELMPAGYGLSCQDCYWSELLERRIKIGCSQLEGSVMQQRFNEYAYWLYEKNGANRAAIKINSHLSLFRSIDEKFQDIPDFKQMMDSFGANKLRHFRLPMQWFENKLGKEVDEEYKVEVTERNRIKKLIGMIDDQNTLRVSLIEYKEQLFEKIESGQIKIRTARLTISAVVDLIGKLTFLKTLDQDTLDKHLIKKPGQKANLTGFINYLNVYRDFALKLRVDVKKAKAYHRAQLQNKMIELIADYVEGDSPRKWILYGLQYFHSLPMRVAGNVLTNGQLLQVDDGFEINWNGEKYFIPAQTNIELLININKNRCL